MSSLGDIIHTLPAVTDARRQRGDIRFDWVVEENFAEVPAWHPAIDRVVPVAIRRWRRNPLRARARREFRAFSRALREVRYDLVIDAQGLIKSGLVSRLSRGLTIGLSNRTIREPLATLFYNKVFSVPWTEHAVDRIRQLFARSLRYHYDRDRIDYGIDPERIGGAPGAERQLVFLHGTTWATKHWPERYWRRLARIAAGAGYRVLLPWGSARERERAEYIARDNGRATVMDRQSLTGLARAIHRSAGVIAVDTGLGHLAAALSRPAVSLYGPTDPELSGIRGPRQLHLSSGLECAPCASKRCRYAGPPVRDSIQGRSFEVTPACFSSHRPEAVWRRFEALAGGGP